MIDQTTLNISFLTFLGACNEAIDFVKRNNLEHFPVSHIDKIKGDHSGWIGWIKNELSTIRECDSNGNMIHYRESNGFEYWQDFDSNGNMIHYKDSEGNEYWQDFDSNRNVIYFKRSDGFEYWQDFDSNGNMIHYKSSKGYEINHNIEYYPSGQVKRYGDMVLPDLTTSTKPSTLHKHIGEKEMKKTNTQTRYAVIARSTGKVMKNASTREVAREWKRNSGKSGLGILDRNSGNVVS